MKGRSSQVEGFPRVQVVRISNRTLTEIRPQGRHNNAARQLDSVSNICFPFLPVHRFLACLQASCIECHHRFLHYCHNSCLAVSLVRLCGSILRCLAFMVVDPLLCLCHLKSPSQLMLMFLGMEETAPRHSTMLGACSYLPSYVSDLP